MDSRRDSLSLVCKLGSALHECSLSLHACSFLCKVYLTFPGESCAEHIPTCEGVGLLPIYAPAWFPGAWTSCVCKTLSAAVEAPVWVLIMHP